MQRNAFGFVRGSRCDASEARERSMEVKTYLYNKPNLAKFLRNTSKFRRQDVEEVLNVDRDGLVRVRGVNWDAGYSAMVGSRDIRPVTSKL